MHYSIEMGYNVGGYILNHKSQQQTVTGKYGHKTSLRNSTLIVVLQKDTQMMMLKQ